MFLLLVLNKNTFTMQPLKINFLHAYLIPTLMRTNSSMMSVCVVSSVFYYKGRVLIFQQINILAFSTYPVVYK